MRIEKWEKETRTLRRHDAAAATYASALVNGERLFQIQTYGSETRQMRGVVSQVIQFDRVQAAELIEILKREFLL